jgi:hypothetical protein
VVPSPVFAPNYFFGAGSDIIIANKVNTKRVLAIIKLLKIR